MMNIHIILLNNIMVNLKAYLYKDYTKIDENFFYNILDHDIKLIFLHSNSPTELSDALDAPYPLKPIPT